MKTLIGPTYEENLWTTNVLFGRYRQDRGITLLVKGTVVTEAVYPYLGDLNEIGYDYIYLGGHQYPLSDAEVTILTDAGYGAFIFDI